MKEEKRYIFTEEDYKLLRKPLPKSPCINCTEICSGCNKLHNYMRTIKPYEYKNLLTYAGKLRDYYSIKTQIDQLNIELCNILSELPYEIIDNVINKNNYQ